MAATVQELEERLLGRDLFLPGPDGVQPTSTGDWPSIVGRDNFTHWHQRNAMAPLGSLMHRPAYGAGLVRRVEQPTTDTFLFLTEITLRESALLDPRTSAAAVSVREDALTAGQVNVNLVVVPVQAEEPAVVGFRLEL